jgi:DNA-binding winged helix-turn-helix (wHTH) protein
MFLNHLYGGMDEPELKIIDVFICKLRKKLSQATGGNNYIETVWGRGYVLRERMAHLLWRLADAPICRCVLIAQETSPNQRRFRNQTGLTERCRPFAACVSPQPSARP